jgi:hypothetical protein
MPFFEGSFDFRIEGGIFVDNSGNRGEHCPIC